MTADDSPYECMKSNAIQVDLFFFFDLKAVAAADVICVVSVPVIKKNCFKSDLLKNIFSNRLLTVGSLVLSQTCM